MDTSDVLRFVAQICNLPYRRIAFGRRPSTQPALKPGGRYRLKIRATAVYKSAPGIFLGLAIVALPETSWGQRASNWRAYRMADGMPESACVAVSVAPNGKVVARHFGAASFSELDGYNITVQPSPPGRNRIYESPGGQLWTVNPEGLQEFKDDAWIAHSVPELTAEFRAGVARLSDSVALCPVRQGVVLVALTDGLFEFNADRPEHPRTTLLRRAGQTGLEKFTGMIVARDGGLWIAGARGLAKAPAPVRNLKPESEWQEYLAPATLGIQNLREPHEDAEGVVTTIAESSGNRQNLVVHFDGLHWTTAAVGAEKIRHAWRGPDRTSWAITATSLLQGEDGRPELTENDDIAARQYYDVAVEPSGNFWLATSDGLFHYSMLTWRSPRAVKDVGSLVHCLAGDKAGQLWFVAGNALHSLQN